MGCSATTIMGVRLGFEIVTKADLEELSVDDFSWALILDLLIFRVVIYK